VTDQTDISKTAQDIQNFFNNPGALGAILVLIISMTAAYIVSRFLTSGIIKIAQIVGAHSDNESNEDRVLRLRQIETYLSVAIAAVRALLVAATGVIVWLNINPQGFGAATTIGASAFFVVFAGQSFGMIMRDITAGAAMIIEKWFNVGDYIKIEPFEDVSGVVERLTLRSTRLRSLNGEIVWVHNQQIMGVHVTPRGVRTMAVDIFVRDRVAGERAIEKIVATVPSGTMMMARPLRIKYAERWDDELWRITVVGSMLPGREWLVERYFVNALKDIDEDKPKSERLIVHEPIARYADSEADRRFKRAVRVAKDK
jgi:small-conductance mechanosensitive channel